MEEIFKDAWGWLGKEIVEFGFGWLVVLGFSGVSFVLGALIFGRGYKKRIAALEARDISPGISQVIAVHGDVNVHNYAHQLRSAIEAKTTHSLTETLRSLPQMPLGDGHTYARLPDGTNIVSMADGSFQLAIPIAIDAAFEGGLRGDLNASVSLGPPPKDDNA